MTPFPPSFTGARWSVLPVDPAQLQRAEAPGRLLPVITRLMALRGFDADAGWLTPSFDHLHDPFAMANMGTAVERLRKAVHDAEKLRVITDYDVDGTTSSLVLQATLGLLGPSLQLDYHIPDRFTEGYGFSVQAAHKAAQDGVGLIVTADIGVRDHAAVDAARAAGVDVLVCDHHLPPGADVPTNATVLCPPQQACAYPNRHLAACGVSLKLAQAMLADHPKRDLILRSLLKLTALGTVADLVPLNTLENRALVSLGIDELNQGRHAPGLAALLEVAGVPRGEVDTQAIGFRIAPRINAAGRIAQATHVVDLLTCRDPVQAARMAHELDALNRERRDVQEALIEHVLTHLPDEPDPFVLVSGAEEDGFHRGVVGIVAARVKEHVHRPVAIVSVQGPRAVGSVRSIPGVHAVRALDTASDVLVKYGGHPMAAGFSIPTEHLGTLRDRLCAYVDGHVDADTLVEDHAVDAELRADEITGQLHAQLQQLAPFGQGNPEPSFALRGVYVDGLRTMGKDASHLKGMLRGAVEPVEVVWWRGAVHAPALQNTPVDLLGSLAENRWKGRRTLQFVVRDARAVA